MGMKEFTMAFHIGAMLSSNFSTAFLTAKKEVRTLADAQQVAANQTKSISKAFNDAVISAESYRNAISKTNATRLNLATRGLGLQVTNTYMAAQGFLGVASAVGGVLQPAIKFEAAMSKVGAISRASAADMERLTATAKELGRKTQFTATQSAEAMSYLGMAGWNASQIIEGMPGLLNLAAAGNVDLARTADIVSDNLTAFGLAASQSGHMADVYATVITQTNTNVEMLGDTMKYAAPVAQAFGATMEETAALAGLMANSGIKASQAGTALRAGFLRLAGPPKMAAKAMSDLGMSMSDITAEQKETALALKSLGVEMSDDKGPKKMSQILTELKDKTKDLGREEKLAALKAIFGTEAATGWLAVLNSSDGTFEKLVKNLENSDGAAKEMADRMQSNAQGAITRYNSAMESLAINLGGTVLPVIAAVADNMAVFVATMAESAPLRALVTVIGTATVALAGFTLAMSAGRMVYTAVNTAIVAYNSLMAISKVQMVASTTATYSMAIAQWALNGAVSGFRLMGVIGMLVRHGAVSAMMTVGTYAMAAAQWALNAAMTANPIGLVIAGIAGLIAIGYTLYSNWDTIKSFFITLWDNPTAAIDTFCNSIRDKFTAAGNWLSEKWASIKNMLSSPIFGSVNITASGNGDGIAHNANGGIYGRGAFLTTFAERSGESAIPHTPTARNIGLLAETNRIMGNPLGGGTINATFSPTINVTGGDAGQLQATLEDEMQRFKRMLTDLQNQQRRTSYA